MKLNNILIKAEIQKVIKTKKAKKIFDGNGLCLTIRLNGGASWQYHYRIGNTPKTLSIGTYPSISLKEARILHQKAILSRVVDGQDPAFVKKAQKAILSASMDDSFSKYCWQWHAMRSKRLSEQYAIDLKHQLNRHVIPVLGDIPIEQVTPPIVVNLLKNLTDKGLGDTARRALQRINAILNYAVQIGALTVNPVLSLTGFVQVPPTEHQLALPEAELTEFFSRLMTENARRHTKIAMLIVVLTFVRSGSIRRVEWEDIDFEEKLWTVPVEKIKGGRFPLVVPLSEWVVSLFKELQRIDGKDSGYIFYNPKDSNKYMSENTLSSLMGRMGYKNIATPHGFRSLATDILNEKSDFSSDIIERQMGHVEENKVRRAYHRTEYLPDRIKMMNWYSSYIKQYYDKAVDALGKGM